MSKAFTSEETPDTGVMGRAARAAAPGSERPITVEGYRALVEELRRLTEEERPRARALAEMERAARLGEIDHRIALLQATLASVRVPDLPSGGEAIVRFGSRVTIEWDSGRRQTLQLVGPDEVDVKAGRISVESPLARSIVGRRAGDEVEIERPRGTETAVVIAVG